MKISENMVKRIEDAKATWNLSTREARIDWLETSGAVKRGALPQLSELPWHGIHYWVQAVLATAYTGRVK